jgi:hypothetical protein
MSPPSRPQLADVNEAAVLRDRIVWQRFEDGSTGVVDLAPMLWGPAFEPLRDDALFQQVSADPEAGTLVWPNGSDLSAETLRALIEAPGE